MPRVDVVTACVLLAIAAVLRWIASEFSRTAVRVEHAVSVRTWAAKIKNRYLALIAHLLRVTRCPATAHKAWVK